MLDTETFKGDLSNSYGESLPNNSAGLITETACLGLHYPYRFSRRPMRNPFWNINEETPSRLAQPGFSTLTSWPPFTSLHCTSQYTYSRAVRLFVTVI